MDEGTTRPGPTGRRLLTGLVFALFVLALVRLPGAPAAQNADRSFRQAYASFLGTGAQEGSDHVFNLGPLGHFAVPVYDARLYGLDVVVAMLLAGCGALALTAAARRHESRVGIAAAAVLGALLIPRGGPETGYLLATVAATLLLVEDDAAPRPAFLAFGFVLGFLGLTKVTFLLLGLVSITVVLAAAIARHEVRLAAAAGGAWVLSLLGFWLAAGQHLASFPRWIAGSLAISSAYNAGMSVEGNPGEIVLGLAALGLGLATAALPVFARPRRLRSALEAGYLTVFLLLEWKHAVVRQHAHMSQLFVPILFLPLLLPPFARGPERLFPRGPARLGLAQRLCATAAVAVALWGHVVAQESTLFGELGESLQRAATRARDVVTPVARHRRLEARRALLAREHALPRYRQRVGDGTVDVFPPFQGILLLNGFRYHPRPVLQGYQACTADLLRRNAAFYAGADAPDFVLYRLAPMDGRYPAMEDGLALQQLFLRYRPAAREGGMLLLARDPEPGRRVPTAPPVTGATRFGQWVRLPEAGGDWQLLRLDVRPSLWGRLRGLVYKLPPLQLAVRLADGTTALHRANVGSLSVPFVLSPYLEQGSTAQGWPGGPPARRVEAFSLRLPRGGETAFAAALSYEISTVAPLTARTGAASAN